MAAQFNVQPASQCSAYRPVRFTFQSDSTAELWERALITVFREGGTQLASFTKDFYEQTGSNPYTHYFEVDVQAVAQALTDPMPQKRGGALVGFDVLNTAGAETALSLYITARFYRRVGSTLEDTGTVLTSNTVTAFGAVRQHEEDQAFSTSLLASPRPLLTYAPARLTIRENELFTISCIQPSGVARVYIRRRTKSGTVTTSSWTISVNTAHNNKRILSAGVGPFSINAVSSWAGTPITIDENTDNYTVGFSNSSNALLTATRQFFLEPDFCGKMLRLAWMNSQGGFEHYTFDAVKKQFSDSKSTSAQRPLSWSSAAAWDARQRGAYKTDIRRSDYWELESRVLDPELTPMLSGLFSSPEVYVEDTETQTLRPAIVSDEGSELYDSTNVGSIIKASVFLANDYITQRN
jgi:hypothetical protein